MDFKKRPTVNGGNVEIVSDKNANNGYCGLDSNARVAVARLASNTPAGNGQQVLADNQTFVPYMPVIKLICTTTNTTPTVMTTDGGAAGSTNQLVLPNDTTVTFRGLITARNTTTDNDSMCFEFLGGIRRGTNASTITLIGTPSKTSVASDGSAWTYTITADTTNGALKISVTGGSSKTISWVCNIFYTGVTG